MFQSLLYGVFKRLPQIIKVVCSQGWEAFRKGKGDLQPWMLPKLRRTLAFLATYRGLGYKFCFFIDGLDECKGYLSFRDYCHIAFSRCFAAY